MLLTHILVALQLLHCYSISAHPLPAEDLVGLRTVETAREAAQSGHLTGPASVDAVAKSSFASEGKITPGEGLALPAQTSKSTAIMETQALREAGSAVGKEVKPNEETVKIGGSPYHEKTAPYSWNVGESEVVSPGIVGRIKIQPSGTYRMSGSQEFRKGENPMEAAQSSKLAQPGSVDAVAKSSFASEGKITPGEGLALPDQTSKSTAIKETPALREADSAVGKEVKPYEETVKIGKSPYYEETAPYSLNVGESEEVSPGSLGKIEFHPLGTYHMSGSQDVGKGETATKAAQSSNLA